jgi:ABC-type protease/lipase transport system fused ATPase/permease subunit
VTRHHFAQGTLGLVAALVLLSACYLPRDSSLAERARSATTRSEHTAVAATYRKQAKSLRAEAVRHAQLAESWSGSAALARHDPPRGQEAEHCRRLSRALLEAADEADALAAAHERMASSAGGSE